MTIDLTNQLHLAAVVLGSGLLGMAGHSIKKWVNKETESPLAYLLRDNLRATVGSLLALLTASAGAIAGDLLAGMTLLQVVLACAPYGYMNDSVVNKGAPPSGL